VVGQINWVLYQEEGFRGNVDDYADPLNSDLDAVLERRTGIPVSLGAVYLAVARGVGLELAGVNLPAHFVLRTVAPEAEFFIDAFHAGAILDRDACARLVANASGRVCVLSDRDFAPMTTAAVLARMLRNLKSIYASASDFASALPITRRLAALDPSNPDESRDWGVSAALSARPGEALDPLAAYLAARPDAADSAAVARILDEARREVAQTN
jgi:regulator of sirC expression with transglutaminase-like and TPR domain